MRKGFFVSLALGGIRKNRKIYYPYILTAILTTAMMYIMVSLEHNTSHDYDAMIFALQLGVVVTSAFSVLFLFYTNSFLMKRRKREFGLYNVLGMEKKHLARVVVWETALILLVSLTLGFGLGILLDKLMYMILQRMVGQVSSLSFYVSTPAMIYTAELVGVTFLLILLNSVRQIFSAKPIELLHSANVGEREPRSKWALTLLGVVTLGAGYYISVTVQDVAMMLLMFFVAVLLVIAGTYLLFTSGSVTMLKLLRRNKRYYYRADHFISVSGMIYRMKQNAVGLGNICILSTMVLIMVFSTVALRVGMEDSLNSRQTRDIEMETNAGSPEELFALADEVLAQSGLTREESYGYRYTSIAAFYSGGVYFTGQEAEAQYNMLTELLTTLYFVPLEDYNRFADQAQTLAPGEVLLEEARGEHPGDTLTVLDETFSVKARMPRQLSNGSAMASMYNCLYVVVDSLETYERLYEKQAQVYGNAASTMRTVISFNLSGTEEQETAFASALWDAAGTYNGRYVQSRVELRASLMGLYGGLLFVGLFLGLLFTMAMILIIYYKQISEGYDDCERYRIMRKVGLSREEIKRSISSQILVVFFLPLVTAGVHIVLAFPAITILFRALSMTNVSLMILCAMASFAVFALLYGLVYLLTARVYYRIVSE